MHKPGLTPKQDRFTQEYLVDLNATQAAIRAGYSARTAKYIGAELLRNPKIQAALSEAMKRRSERLETTADDVVREITRLAMFDPGELTSVASPQDIKKLPEDARRAIVGWAWDRNGNFVIKMAKEKALEMLGRYHALFQDKVEHFGEVSVIGLAERMRKRAAEQEKAQPQEREDGPGEGGLAARMRQRRRQGETTSQERN